MRQTLTAIRQFNDWMAGVLSSAMSTMAMFWVITALCLAAFAIERPTGAQGWILFWVSIFFQGVALPVLAFVSDRQGTRVENVLRETHDTVVEELAQLKELHLIEMEELATIRERNEAVDAQRHE